MFGRICVGDAPRIRGGVRLDLSSSGESGFVEASMLEHKRSAKVQRKVPLPIAAPISGIARLSWPWAVTWARLRADEFLQDDHFDEQPLIQSVLAGGECLRAAG